MSTLKLKASSGREEPMLQAKGKSNIRTRRDEISPAMDPAIAKPFPQKFAAASLFLKIREPAAPQAKSINDTKKLNCEDAASAIMIFQNLFSSNRLLQEFSTSGRGLLSARAGRQEWKNRPV